MSRPDISDRSRFRAFIITLASGQVLTLVTLLASFLATPILLQYLGSARFGAWRVLEVWLSYFGLIPQCVSQAVGFLLVPLLAQSRPDRLRQFVGTMLAIGCGVNLLITFSGILLLPYLQWLAPLPEQILSEYKVAFLIALITPLVLTPFLMLRTLLEADQRGYWVNIILAVQSLVTTSVAVGLAIYNYGLLGQALASVVGTCIQAVLLLGLSTHLYHWLLPGQLHWPDVVAIYRRASELFLLGILGGISARLEILVVNYFVGVESTAEYSLGQRLFQIYSGLVTAIGNSLWPFAASLFFSPDRQRFQSHIIRSIYFTLWLGIAGSVAIFPLTPAFLNLWVGSGYDSGLLTRLGFAISFPCLGVNVLLTWMLSSTGHIRIMYLITVIYFLMTCIAAISLGSWLGSGGVAIGTAAGIAVASAVSLWAASSAFQLSLGNLILHCSKLALGGLIIGYGFFLFVSLFSSINWFMLILLLASGWASYLLVAWFIILPRTDRQALLARLTLYRTAGSS